MLRLITAAIIALPLAAQDAPDSAAMARQMALAQPGPEHQRLASLAGDWEATFSMAGGLAFTAPVRNTMIMGGRFLSSLVQGDAGGMPFEALTIIGFDRGPGIYTSVGFDTFGTFYVTGEGPWNPAVGGADLAGSYADRVTGHMHEYVFAWRVYSSDHYTWTIVFLEDGEQQTVMEGDYRRR